MWKICGMTRRKDIDWAVECGADCIGFVFAPSPRQLSPDQVRQLTHRLVGVQTVGVFVDQSVQAVSEIRSYCQLDRIQLHGGESPEYCEQLGGSIIKAFRMQNADSLQAFRRYPESITLLLDAYEPERAGGTGRRISLAILDQINDFSRIILAGGVGPDNARTLIERYHPYGLDMNSALESSPGIKDHDAIRKAAKQLGKI